MRDFSNAPEKKRRSILAAILLALGCLGLFIFIYFYDYPVDPIINEFMASNRFVLEDEDGDYPDWIEIYNPSRFSINLEGYWLSDDTEEPYQWEFPDVEIEPGEYVVVFASGKDRSKIKHDYLHTNFRISRSGDTVIFGDPEGEIVDEIIFDDEIPSNISYGRISVSSDEWFYFLDATPGAPNEAKAYESVLDMPFVDEAFPVYINEFLVRNRTSMADEDGDLYEWIELYNSGDEPVNLDGFWLSDKVSNPYKWKFPPVIIEPDEYLVVFASGKNRRDSNNQHLHTTYGLNDRDDELVFKKPDGRIIEIIPIRDQFTDVSYGRDPADQNRWLYFPQPTPGKNNYTTGYDSLTGFPLVEEDKLYISEVMAVNIMTIADEDGDYYDWIEIHNTSEDSINLKGFGLSDDPDNLFRWSFPDIDINSGEYLLIFASGKDRRNPDEEFLHTNFKIQATGETVVLTHPEGHVINSMHTGKLLPDHSIGRFEGTSTERYFFTNPTPGEPNCHLNVYESYASAPEILPKGSFFDEPVTVILKADSPDAEIHYTLDGSEPVSIFSQYERSFLITDTARLQPPTDSKGILYTGPIEINETAVLRAKVIEDGKLPSETINHTFFIQEEHNLPVLSLYVDPSDMFDPIDGIYAKGLYASEEHPHRGANFWQSIELPVHFELYEPCGSLGFKFDMGLRIAGQYSRADPQKSFNMFARNIYGYNEFKYPFFPDFYPEKPLANKAITLRTSGQDWRFTKIRDIFMTSLLQGTGLDYQAHRQAVLYINGQYWGLYTIRERINTHFLYYNHGVDPEQIDLLQGNGWVRDGSNEHYFEMVNYVRNNDMSDPDHYQYIKTCMDVVNYLDYWIAQIYFAHTDSANIRFWREQSPEGKWRWIVFDLDWAFWGSNYGHNTLRFVTNPAGTGYNRALSTALMCGLLDNPDFRQLFIERLAYHLNNTFETDRVIKQIERLAGNIENEMPRHLERWGGSMVSWMNQIDMLTTFAANRQPYLLSHIQAYFSLSDDDMDALFNEWTN